MIRQQFRGFAMIEIVIVILVLGIIATVAAPRMFDPAASIDRHTTVRQLEVLRRAIELYHGRTGSYPPLHGLPTTMESMLSGPFPTPLVGSTRGDSGVYYDPDPNTNTPVAPDPTQPGGWAYKPANGSLKLNVAEDDVGFNW